MYLRMYLRKNTSRPDAADGFDAPLVQQHFKLIWKIFVVSYICLKFKRIQSLTLTFSRIQIACSGGELYLCHELFERTRARVVKRHVVTIRYIRRNKHHMIGTYFFQNQVIHSLLYTTNFCYISISNTRYISDQNFISMLFADFQMLRGSYN